MRKGAKWGGKDPPVIKVRGFGGFFCFFFMVATNQNTGLTCVNSIYYFSVFKKDGFLLHDNIHKG